MLRRVEPSGVGYVVAAPNPQRIKSLAGFGRIDELIQDALEGTRQRFSCR